jgi:electron transfer flavoprotein alpha subunit
MAPLIVLPAPAGQRGLSAPDSSTPAEPQVVAADRTVSGARLHGSGRARKAVAYSALAFVLGAAVAGARAVISRAHNRGDG